VALGIGVAIVLVFALVFSVSFGTKGIAAHAGSLHDADEALRAATVARSQGGLSAHLVLLQTEFGFDAAAGLETTTTEARAALNDLDASLAGLEERGLVDESLREAATGFRATVAGILDALEAGDLAAARSLANETLDPAFRSLIGYLVVVRDGEAAAVAAANDTMGRIGDLARFLVAFIVPTAVILAYRELARRQQRQSELEVRLQAEQSIGKARDEFVANASHELRTPLTSIFGLAHVLEEDPLVQQSETAPEMVGMIISETHDLSRMVDDLLTTARLDAGALHYQFEHLAVLDEVHEVVEPMRRSGLSVAVDVQPSVVRSDRLRLRQVIRNLLSNASKYGGPRVRIIGRVVSGWYEVRVEDDGEGIPKDLEERLFQRFLHQGDAPLILGSVGLGLSIVRALAEGMGGAVWYERTGDGWTAFVVRVPLAPAGAETPAYREPGTAGGAAPSHAAAGHQESVPVIGDAYGPGAGLLPDGYDELPAPPPFDPQVPARAGRSPERDSLREVADQLLEDL
jgi:signal transduction histidine kinase